MKYSQKIIDANYEKVSLKRSKITVVGGEKGGKTSVINSLMGLDFQKHYESTKGIQISEFDVHDIQSHSFQSDRISFQKVERDGSSIPQAVSSSLIDSSRGRDSDTKKNEKSQHSQKLHSDETDEICSMEEGRNTTKKVEGSDFSGSTISIRFNIHDYCGHRVFQCIQNLFLTAESIFIVVFDMTKILDDEERRETLEHVEYWLSSIKLSVLEEGSDKSPPVILIGTHYDMEKTNADSISVLNFIDKTVRDILPPSDHASYSNSIGKSESILHTLRNDDQGLCFWPVDNSNPLDSNILKLRQLLLDTAMKKDNGSDSSKEISIKMLQVMDKLTEISKEQPFIPICNSSDTVDTPSVMQIMSDCGIFDEPSNSDKNKEVCMELLMRYHSIGQFIYLHQIPALQEYCILDHQWLINMIIYIVRDFRYHWFLRDRSAIELNGGKLWNRLKDDGILEMSLLRRLWIGSHDQIDFLSRILVEMGILGTCAHFYTVPLLPTIPSEHFFEVSKKEVDKYFSSPRIIGEINLREQNFALVPFYCSLTNAMMTDTVEPIILPSGCIFKYLQTGHEFAFLLDPSRKRIFIVSSCSRWEISGMQKFVDRKCKSVNQRFYKNQLEIVIKGYFGNSIFFTFVRISLFFAFIAVIIGFDSFNKGSSDDGGLNDTWNDEPHLSMYDARAQMPLTAVRFISNYNYDGTDTRFCLKVKSLRPPAQLQIRACDAITDQSNWFYFDSKQYLRLSIDSSKCIRWSNTHLFLDNCPLGATNLKRAKFRFNRILTGIEAQKGDNSRQWMIGVDPTDRFELVRLCLRNGERDNRSCYGWEMDYASESPSLSPTSSPSEPSSFPTECEDEEGWRVGGESEYKNMNCTQVASEENWCDAIWALNDHAFNGKGVKEACCACQGSRFTSTYPSTVPSTKPSISMRPSVISENPSAAPSSQPSDCIDEPNWFFNENESLGCTAISEEPETFCEQFSSIWYKDKNTYLACCDCGGGLHQSVAPSVIPTSSPSVLPSNVPSLSFEPTRDITLNPSEKPSVSPSFGPSSLPSVLPSDSSEAPSFGPSSLPSENPSMGSDTPSLDLSSVPSENPSDRSAAPSIAPSNLKSNYPSNTQNVELEDVITMEPSSELSEIPSSEPSVPCSSITKFKDCEEIPICTWIGNGNGNGICQSYPNKMPSSLPSLSSEPSMVPSSVPSGSIYPSALP